MKSIVTLWLYSSAKPDLGILSDLKMEHFTTTDNGLHYDAPFDFLKRFWSFELLFAQMGFGLNNKDDKDSIEELYSRPCKTSKTKLFIHIAYYSGR